MRTRTAPSTASNASGYYGRTTGGNGGRRRPRRMRVGSTFSGVGGLDLGLERAGHRIAFQVELDAYRREVLARHWATVPRWDDVATFDPEPWRGKIDLLCGGFPCQDVSRAGPRLGL